VKGHSEQVFKALSEVGGTFTSNENADHHYAYRAAVHRMRDQGYEIEQYLDKETRFVTWTTKSYDPDQKPKPKRPYTKRKPATKPKHPPLGATLTVTTLGLDKDGSILIGFSDGWVARLES
jgi:hypothetical protein